MVSEVREARFQDLIDEGILHVNDGYRAKHSELGIGGPIFLRSAHLQDSGFDFSGVQYFNDDATARVASKMAMPGDTVVTTKGNSTGRTGYVSDSMPPFVYSPHLSFWRSLDRGTLKPLFLRYWAQGPEFRDQLNGLKESTDMAPYLSLTDQRMLRITLPCPETQEAIGSLLGALDDKIEGNRLLNQTLEVTCQALFRCWFVDFEPVVAKSEGRRPPHLTEEVTALFPNRFESASIGPVPMGWTVEPLDAIASFENGLALQKHRPAPGEAQLPVIKIAQLRDGAPGEDEWASASIKESCVLEDGDVVFSWSGSLMVAIWCGGRGALNQHLFKVTSERFPRWFYHQWTLHHLPEFQGIAADKATTMGHIRRHHLTEAVCVVPPPALVAVADRLLGPCLEHYVATSIQSRTLATLRDALLPRLLSGELRVCQAEKLVEEAI